MRPFHRLRPSFLLLAAGLHAASSDAKPPLVPSAGAPPLPVGLTVEQGSAVSERNGRQLNIRTSPNALLQWQDFSIGAGYGVNFEQLNAQSQVINRVSGQNPSIILGSLSSNGKIWLLNPNGVLFGRDARVDVGGLIASTLDLRDADFASGRYQLAASAASGPTPAGEVSTINQGRITTAYGGQILLVSPVIDNSGSLNAAGGQASLIATDSLELIDTGLPFLGFKVPLANGSATHSGSIQARQIDVYGGVVNQHGLVRAESLSFNAQGQIVLSAKDALDISGSLDASNTDGPGGQILLHGDTIKVHGGAVLNASGADGGGVIATSRPNEEQTVSSFTLIEAGAQLKADATLKGNGGEIWLWSQSGTQVFGLLSTRGGPQGGNGGFVETSSHSGLQVRQAPDIGASHGLGGNWLLDPDRIIIQDSGAGPEILLTQTVEDVLNAGGTITVSAGDAVPGAPYGDVIVDGAIEKTAGGDATLVINAANDLDINQPITSSFGKLNLVLNPNSDSIGFSGSTLDASLDLNGGILTLDHGPSTPSGPLYVRNGAMISNATILPSDGSVTVAIQQASTFNNVTLGTGTLTSLSPDVTLSIQNQFQIAGTFTGETLDLGNSTLTLLDQSTITQTRIIGSGQAQIIIGPNRSATFNAVTLDGGILSTTVESDSTLNIANALSLNSLLQLVSTQTVAGQGQGATLLFLGTGPNPVVGNGLIKTRDFDSADLTRNDTATIRGANPSTQVQIGSGITLQHEANALEIDNLTFSAGQIIVNGASRLDINANSPTTSLTNNQLIRGNSGSQIEVFSELSNVAGATIQSEGGQIKLDRLNNNAGTIQVGVGGFGGTITIHDPLSALVWLNSGIIRAAGSGRVDLYGDWSNASPGLFDAAGGIIAFDSPFTTQDIGVANSSGGGRYEIGPGGAWNNNAQSYNLNPAGHLGTVTFTGSDSDNSLVQARLIGGSITGSPGSALRIASFSSAIFDGVTLGNGLMTTIDANGLLLIENGLVLNGALLRLITENNDAAQGTELIFRSIGDVDDPQAPHLSGNGSVLAARIGNIGGGNALIASEDGNLIIDSGITIESQNDLLRIQGLSLNQGRLRSAGGSLAVEGFDWTNAGLIEAGEGDIQLGGLIDNSGTIHSIGGDIEVQPIVSLLSGPGFANSGIIRLDAHTTFTALDGFTNADVGDILGSGTIDVGENALINQGKIDPGYLSQIGTLSILGNYTQESSGLLWIDARSPAGVDVLDISGAAHFSGRLRLVLARNYEPGPDDVLTVARYDSRTGRFENFSAPSAPDKPRLTYQDRQLEISALKIAAPPVEPPPTPGPPSVPPPSEPPPSEPPPMEPPPTEPPPTEPPPVEPPPVEPPPTQPPPAEPPPGEVPAQPVGDQGPAVQAVATNLDKLPNQSLTSIKPAEGLSTATVVDASRGGDFDSLIEGIGRDGTGLDDPGRILLTDGNIIVFRNLPVEQLGKSDIKLLLDAREAYKDNVFADAILALEKNPEMANLPFCASLQEADIGSCILSADLQKLAIAKRRASAQANAHVEASIPLINRKRALVIGLNQYRDPKIPQLTSALPDARLIGQELSLNLGYEVTMLANPSKREITRWLNRMALEMSETDSLVIYFAGHGEMVDKTGLGYWIPSDATARDASGWISNSDVSHWLGLMQSKQVALIIDSCYSGTFASHDGLSEDDGTSKQAVEKYLDKRSVAVMTSGSDEPVADTGNDGHSLFAWNLIQQLQSLDSWTPGANLFLSVRDQVERELPQSPQYGAALKAGHQPGGDFLFERRKILR